MPWPRLRTLGIGGLSVTMPHKAAAHDAVDEPTPVAAELGAVNCVFRRDDRLVGDNTDGAGFLDALRLDAGVDVAGRRCVVVGAGGAGRAVARALGGAGAAEVAVVNRSPEPRPAAAALAGPARPGRHRRRRGRRRPGRQRHAAGDGRSARRDADRCPSTRCAARRARWSSTWSTTPR